MDSQKPPWNLMAIFFFLQAFKVAYAYMPMFVQLSGFQQAANSAYLCLSWIYLYCSVEYHIIHLQDSV